MMQPREFAEYERLLHVARRLQGGSRMPLTAPGDLVHDAYLRHATRDGVAAGGDSVGLEVTPRDIHDAYVSDVRRQRAARRGGRLRRVQPDRMGRVAARHSEIHEVMASAQVTKAIEMLARIDAPRYEVAYLRVVAGLTERQIAVALSTCERTVRRRWRSALDALRGLLEERPTPLS